MRRHSAQRRKRGRKGSLGFAGIATFLAVLELVPRVGIIDARFLPPLSQMVAALSDQVQTQEFWQALADTLTTWATGLAIALGAGIVIGMVVGSVALLRAATASTIEFLRPVPSVALIPLAVLLFGTGMEATLLLVVPVHAYAERTGVEPDSATTHQRCATLASMAGDGILWPPGRNDPCWCGSARKYKKCCSSPGFAAGI